MIRPPLWSWALPAAVAAGVLVGQRIAPCAAPAATALLPATPAAAAGAAFPADTPVPRLPEAAVAGATGLDGGEYQPLAELGGDTLPSAPAISMLSSGTDVRDVSALPYEGAPAVAPVGPAQALPRALAFARPLVASVQGGRLSYYSAWVAADTRSSLVGEWAAVADCSVPVWLGYEQPVPGIGAVRGSGTAPRPPGWAVALVIPRQHCAFGRGIWEAPRRPSMEERGLLAEVLGGEEPQAVVNGGGRAWVASATRVAIVRIAAGGVVEEWSEVAPDGASVKLLGRWQGDGVWAAVQPGGRVVRVWRRG